MQNFASLRLTFDKLFTKTDTLFTLVAFIWSASRLHDSNTAMGQDWLLSVRSKQYYGSNDMREEERSVVGALHEIQKSKARSTGLISSEPLATLHEQVWELIISGHITDADVGVFTTLLAEVRKMDREDERRQHDELARRGEDARQKLQLQSEVIVEQIRLFSEFVENRDKPPRNE